MNTTSSQNLFSSTQNVQSEAQVTTFVRELDTQGPAVVQRITTQVGELACTPDTVQNLVDALHNGRSVTLTSNVNGTTKSTTFNASGTHLGYGEAYIAIALAAQQLRNAGVSGCATPEQWQAVLLGGPLNTSISSSSTNSFASASGSTTVPGIVTLHTQGQGWGQIAQSSNLQLGQIISSRSDLSARSSTSTSSTSPSPTGFSSAEMNRARSKDSASHEESGERLNDKKQPDQRKDKDALEDDTKKNPDSSSSSSSANSRASDSTSAQPSDR